MDNLEEMDKFLEKYKLPKLYREEIGNMNKPITKMEIETVTKNLPTNKSQSPHGFTGEFYQKLREEQIFMQLKPFQKIAEEGKLPTRPLIRQGHHHPITKSEQRCHREKIYR